MKYIFLISILAFSTANAADTEKRYQECTALTSSQPDKAETKARQWFKQDKDSVSAQHCLALALYGQGKFRDAAWHLEELADKITKKQTSMWLELMQQAATAREQAKQPLLATTLISKALPTALEKSHTTGVSMLIMRARLYGAQKEYLKGIQDADQADNMSPNNASVLIERAYLLAALKEKKQAMADINKVLSLDAKNKRALTLKAKLSQASS